MKKINILLILFFNTVFINKLFSEEIFSNKTFNNFYMSPNTDSPIIYPVELGHKMLVKEKNDGWVKVLDDRNDVIKNSDIIVQLELPNDDVLLNFKSNQILLSATFQVIKTNVPRNVGIGFRFERLLRRFY